MFFENRDYAQYLAEWKKEAVLIRDDASLRLVDAAAKGFATAGAQGMLRNTLALQKKLYESGMQSSYSVAETDSLLGNKQEALQYLKVAYDKHDNSMMHMESDPAFATLHHEPAYQDLVAKLGFPARN
jgi:hypothetical protein